MARSDNSSLIQAAPANDDFRICRRCQRGWGSVIVTPPAGYFSLYNSKTGRFHGRGRTDKTACGIRTTGTEWVGTAE